MPIREIPLGDVIKEGSILSETIEYDAYKTSILKNLKTATKRQRWFTVGSEDGSVVKGLVINLTLDDNAATQTVYVRSFYDRLLKSLWSQGRAVLIGNPGVSKSWFQWYVIYRLVNQVQDQADVKDEFNEPIKVIARQVGSDYFALYLPKQDTVLWSTAIAIRVSSISCYSRSNLHVGDFY